MNNLQEACRNYAGIFPTEKASFVKKLSKFFEEKLLQTVLLLGFITKTRDFRILKDAFHYVEMSVHCHHLIRQVYCVLGEPLLQELNRSVSPVQLLSPGLGKRRVYGRAWKVQLQEKRLRNQVRNLFV